MPAPAVQLLLRYTFMHIARRDDQTSIGMGAIGSAHEQAATETS